MFCLDGINGKCQCPVRPECRCKSGFIRDSGTHKCIPKKQCTTCNKGEFWNNCGSGCDVTCQNRANPPLCHFGCVPKCSCEKGLIRDEITNRCIPEKQCPRPKCPENSYWNTCGSNCEQTCANKPVKCTRQCIEKCSCNKGYIYDEDLNICVLPYQCPNHCGRNEYFHPKHIQEYSCDGSTKMVEGGCVCQTGYLRNGNICVPKKDCPIKTCGRNEHLEKCPVCADTICCHGNKCQTALCFAFDCFPGMKCQCPVSPECRCNSGYVRDAKTNMCITKKQCDSQNLSECPIGEYWNTCGSGCELTCQNKKRPPLCDFACVPKCSCNKGLIRDMASKKCVPESECPLFTCRSDEDYTSCPLCDEEKCGAELPPICVEYDCGFGLDYQSNPMCPCPVRPACRCKSGLFRHPRTSKCVTKDICLGRSRPVPPIFPVIGRPGVDVKPCSKDVAQTCSRQCDIECPIYLQFDISICVTKCLSECHEKECAPKLPPIHPPHTFKPVFDPFVSAPAPCNDAVEKMCDNECKIACPQYISADIRACVNGCLSDCYDRKCNSNNIFGQNSYLFGFPLGSLDLWDEGPVLPWY